RLDPPVTVAVHDVAPVPLREQHGVEPRIVRPRFGVGPHTDLVATVGPSPAGPASCDRRTPAAVTTAVVRHGVGPYRRGVATTEPDRSSRRGPGTNVVLLVAHGSRNPRAAPEHEELCARVARQASELAGEPVEVRPAYLEI